VYEHKDNRCRCVFRDYPLEHVVYPHHLLIVRSVLDEYGIADPLSFAAQLQQAG